MKPTMKPNFKNTSIVMLAVVLCLGFQNCSKVNFAATDGDLVGKTGGLGDGLEDQDFPENEELNPELVDDDDDLIDNEGGADCEQFAATDVINGGISGINVRIHKFRGNLAISNSETLDLSNIRGSVFAKTGDALHLRNIRGGLCLVGNTIAKLNNHRGNIEIIGADSQSISNTRGTLTINGGSAALISNHRGNIILKNGATVTEIRNHRGDVVVVPL